MTFRLLLPTASGHPGPERPALDALPTDLEGTPAAGGFRCSCTHRHQGCAAHGPEPRERAVPCRACHQHTWSLDGICDPCRGSRADARRSGADQVVRAPQHYAARAC